MAGHIGLELTNEKNYGCKQCLPNKCLYMPERKKHQTFQRDQLKE